MLQKKVPIWIMRQAGRYLPEYRELRKTSGQFLDLCFNTEKITEVTLQPINRFDFDAAIIFSDILVLPYALGWNVRFEENIGPILDQFKSEKDLKLLEKTPTNLEKVYTAISNTRAKLQKEKSLIGFAGAPWTVMSYLLEGRGKQDFSVSKEFIYRDPATAKKLIDLLTEKTIEHLSEQIKAGVDVVQIFDSWAGVLCEEEYEEFVIKPTQKIVSYIKNNFPNILVIGFPLGSGTRYEKYIDSINIDVIGVDQFVPLDLMQKWQDKVTVQGNLDPVVLLTNKEVIARKVDKILEKLKNHNFIFNLGHGILPRTPIENVEFLVNYVREHSK